MASTYKVLGQSNPSATTLTTLYTVPAATSAVTSTLSVCNTGSASTLFRVAVRVAGEAIATKQYLVYDAQIDALGSTLLTLGIALGAGDVVSVYAGTATVAFQLFGCEMS